MSVKKVEQKIAYRNNKLTLHSDKWNQSYLHSIYNCNCKCNFDINADEVTFTKYLPLPQCNSQTVSFSLYAIAIWCPLLEKESKQRSFLCVLAFCFVLFAKTIVLYFL